MRIEFDGRDYSGFQRQTNVPSVQGALEHAATPLSKEPVIFHSAGRTDAGVHALGLVVHADLTTRLSASKLVAAMNGLLRDEAVSVLDIRETSDTFHARFSAYARRYRYLILNRQAPPAVNRGRCWHVPRPLDVTTMREAAARLIGHHDFTSFRSTHCQSRSPVKTLSRLSVRRSRELIIITAHAPSFLHHQVRNLTGTLVDVGTGRRTAASISDILEARDRRAAGATAPAEGLYFEQVWYPSEIDPFLPSTHEGEASHDPD